MRTPASHLRAASTGPAADATMPDESLATSAPEARPAWRDLFTGRNAVSSLALGGSVALHAVNIYVAVTIMPSAVEDIGGLAYYAWATTLFVLASILGAALSGGLLNRAGARDAYAIAALVFAAGTLVCAIGLISAMWGFATLIGPAVGGIFAQMGAWRAAFWSLIPVAALFGLMAFVALPGRSGERQAREPLPVGQLLLLSVAVLLLSVGSIGHDRLWNVVSILGTVAVIGLLLAVESRATNRLLPTGALKLSAPLGAFYATIALLMIGMQPNIFVPYLLQRLHAQPPLIAGYLAALLAIGWTSGSILSATWQDGGARRGVLGGPSLCLFGLGLLAFTMPLQSGGSAGALLPISLGLLCIGFGIGLAWPHLVTGILQAASPHEQTLATAAMTTVQLAAAALGAAAAGVVANIAGIAQPGGVAGASRAAVWLFGSFTVIPMLCILTARRTRASPMETSR